MSAYIVDKTTIDAIVSWAINPRHSFPVRDLDGDPKKYVRLTDLSPDDIGQNLWNENHRSVNCRYNDRDTPDVYRFSRLIVWRPRGEKYTKPLTALDIIKLCHCLDYQSCEHPQWEASWAKHFLDRVVSSATHSLPGYDEAPWGLHKHETA